MMEEKVATTIMVMEAAKKGAANSIRYRASTEFKDEVQEAVCNVFIKGFKECKRKMARLFYLPDLQGIVPVEPEDSGDAEQPARATLTKLPDPE